MQLDVQEFLQSPIAQKCLNMDLWLKILVRFLVIVSLYMLAKLIWLWVGAFTIDTNESMAVLVKAEPRAQQNTPSVFSSNTLINKHLFGDATVVAQPVTQVTQAEVTKLNLKLRGVYSSEVNKNCYAIIEGADAKQNVYTISEKIKGTRATLHEVRQDAVVLAHNGKYELLELPKVKLMAKAKPVNRRSFAHKRPVRRQRKTISDETRQKLNDIKKQLQEDPLSLKDAIGWQIVRKDGDIQGLKIRPGKERKLFYDSGLKRGDIITSINGTSMTDPAELLTLQQSLPEASEINLSVIRKGQVMDIVVNLSEENEKNDE